VHFPERIEAAILTDSSHTSEIKSIVRTIDGEYSLGPRVLCLGKLYEQSFQLAYVVDPSGGGLRCSLQYGVPIKVFQGCYKTCVCGRLRDEYTAAFSVPVFGEGNAFQASLTLSGPVARIEIAKSQRKFDVVLLTAAYTLSRQLGASLQLCERVFGSVGSHRFDKS
jgi:hypothetical protein